MPEKNDPITDRVDEPRTVAPELAGVSLNNPTVASTATSQKESLPASALTIKEDKFPFTSFVHGYVWASILLAEQKAGFVFAANTAFTGYLATTIPVNFLKMHFGEEFLLFSALASLTLSIASVIAVVIPRLGGDLRGLIYFRAIASRAKAGDTPQRSSAPVELTSTQRPQNTPMKPQGYVHANTDMCGGLFGFHFSASWRELFGSRSCTDLQINPSGRYPRSSQHDLPTSAGRDRSRLWSVSCKPA
jgi:hypothetical protein